MLLSRWSERMEMWARIHAHTRRAKWVLAIVAFAESSVFPIPPDVLLIGIHMMKVPRWWMSALVTTISSVLGGAFGYLIGYFFFDSVGQWIVTTYGLEDQLVRVGVLFTANAFLAIFTAGFTPIPYKVFTIASGFFHIQFPIFLFASILSRGARFMLVAFLADRYGGRVAHLIFRYLDIALIIFVVALAVAYVFSMV